MLSTSHGFFSIYTDKYKIKRQKKKHFDFKNTKSSDKKKIKETCMFLLCVTFFKLFGYIFMCFYAIGYFSGLIYCILCGCIAYHPIRSFLFFFAYVFRLMIVLCKIHTGVGFFFCSSYFFANKVIDLISINASKKIQNIYGLSVSTYIGSLQHNKT